MAIIVTLPYDPTWQALAWAKKNCPSYITNDRSDVRFTVDCPDIDYFFGNEKEALMFRLKWL